MPDVFFRGVKGSDLVPLAEMINSEWKFDIYSKENGLKMAMHYLLICIDGSNAARVLEVEGKTAGIIVVSDMDGPKIDMSAERDRLLAEMSGDPGLEDYQKDFKALYGTYSEFAEHHKRPDWSELKLLILSNQIRGGGLGRKMMEEAKAISRSFGMKGLFFYTDNDCNTGFYDHIGAVRTDSKRISLMGEELDVFGYSYVF